MPANDGRPALPSRFPVFSIWVSRSAVSIVATIAGTHRGSQRSRRGSEIDAKRDDNAAERQP